MVMVGLFWVTADAVYVGSPPTAIGDCVRLTSDGLEAVDRDDSRAWTWAELRSAVVEDVPTAGTAGRVSRLLGSMVSAAAGAFIGEGPPEMRLRLETGAGPQEATVYAAAAGGYEAHEAELSQDLLARLVAGTADPGATGAWGREPAREGTPEPDVRKALLQTWARPRT
ncbi:hypothetical protein ACIRUY_31035 [Streptomyces erythrochromogenes]|uniref:hypothetical protein n=1 Tax=Streptomyces erythrochromogenes TaxID=285574 RepID=UPI003828724B